MEPISALAAAAATVFATKAAEEAGSQTGKGLSGAAGRLVAWLRGKGHEDAEAGAALTMVQAVRPTRPASTCSPRSWPPVPAPTRPSPASCGSWSAAPSRPGTSA